MIVDEFSHQTVMLDEAVDALVTRADGCYLDGTFGRGGHSREILRRLNANGCLLGVDRDPQAVATGQRLAAEDSRFNISHGEFSGLASYAQEQGWNKVDGILLDLGVSSPQLDDAERGFSFLRDGPLDMRMNPTQGESASQWLMRAKEDEIAWVLKEYGEEKFARRMAAAIVKARQVERIERTAQLARIVSEANPRWEVGKNPATRAFQAIRIYINGELDEVTRALEQAAELLAVGGRLVVISFHSLEDRIVKRFMRDQVKGDPLPAKLPIMAKDIPRRFRLVDKATKATDAEVNNNPRSRSAVMRVMEKIA